MKLPNQALPIMRYASTATIIDETRIGVRPSGTCYEQANCAGNSFNTKAKKACCKLGGTSYLAATGNCSACP